MVFEQKANEDCFTTIIVIKLDEYRLKSKTKNSDSDSTLTTALNLNKSKSRVNKLTTSTKQG